MWVTGLSVRNGEGGRDAANLCFLFNVSCVVGVQNVLVDSLLGGDSLLFGDPTPGWRRSSWRWSTALVENGLEGLSFLLDFGSSCNIQVSQLHTVCWFRVCSHNSVMAFVLWDTPSVGRSLRMALLTDARHSSSSSDTCSVGPLDPKQLYTLWFFLSLTT